MDLIDDVKTCRCGAMNAAYNFLCGKCGFELDRRFKEGVATVMINGREYVDWDNQSDHVNELMEVADYGLKERLDEIKYGNIYYSNDNGSC